MMAKPWNVSRLSGIGFLLGVIFSQTELFFYPQSASWHFPIVAGIFGGLMFALVFGGAALSHNRFPSSMSKFTDRQPNAANKAGYHAGTGCCAFLDGWNFAGCPVIGPNPGGDAI
jgi:hypothetical protein